MKQAAKTLMNMDCRRILRSLTPDTEEFGFGAL